MVIKLELINEINYKKCIGLEVSDEQKCYIASNQDSLNEAKENEGVARPFLIWANDKVVGFTMFAFDESLQAGERYWLWRFMIDKNEQGKGYGKAALKEIVEYFKVNHASEITLSTKETNTTALNLYHTYGFKENGEMNDEEIVLKLCLNGGKLC